MKKYLLHGKLTAADGQTERLAGILLEASRLISTAKGCNPTAVWVTEVWDSREDHDQSLHLPGVRELIGQALPILAGTPQKGQELEVIGGTGV